MSGYAVPIEEYNTIRAERDRLQAALEQRNRRVTRSEYEREHLADLLGLTLDREKALEAERDRLRAEQEGLERALRTWKVTVEMLNRGLDEARTERDQLRAALDKVGGDQ